MKLGPVRQLAAAALVAAVAVAFPLFGHAQAIEDLTPGNDKAALWPFGNPKETKTSAGYTTNRYLLASGAELAVTFDISTSRIVALEESWAGNDNGPSAGFGDFRFGRTTLTDIRSRTSSNGILYKQVTPVGADQSGAINFSSFYDVTSSTNVVRFVTSIDRAALGRLSNRYGERAYYYAGSAALLRSVTVATREYLEKSTGTDRVLDSRYTSVSWAPAVEAKPAKPAISLARIKPSQLPVFRIYDGPRNFPDFTGRDSKFSMYRTRITNGMTDGPTFAGEYSVIQIGCGTSCSFVYVADNRTGEVFNAPVGGEDNLSLELRYEVGSKLMTSQWGDYNANKCFVQFYSFDDGEWTELLKREVGTLDACMKTVADNIQ
jgi:hypothetical protein